VPLLGLDVNCFHCLEFEGGSLARTPVLAENIEIRQGSARDLEGMSACGNYPERLPERFKSPGEHCVLATSRGKVIGYQWFSEKPARMEERYSYKVEIPLDAVYGYDAFVLPQWRRSKVWTEFHRTYLRDLLSMLGRRRIIVMVDRGNAVSMNAHLRLGYKLYQKIYILKIAAKSFCFKRDAAHNTNMSRSHAPAEVPPQLPPQPRATSHDFRAV
jgi:hypothetical protein